MITNNTAPTSDDLELLHRYLAQGEPESIRVLVQRYQRMVFATCLRRLDCSADAEDAAQEVFLSLMENAGKVRSNVGAWLHRCAMNTSASMIRSRRSRTRRELEKARLAPDCRRDAQTSILRERIAILHACLGEIDETDRNLLLQNCVMGSTQKELASSLGVTQQAVAKRIGKALALLRRGLSARGVFFSIVAAVTLLARKVASAAIPRYPQFPLGTLSPSPIVSAGAIKLASAMLLLTAAVTYQQAADRRQSPSAPEITIAAVQDTSANRPVVRPSVRIAGSTGPAGLAGLGDIPLTQTVTGAGTRHSRAASGLQANRLTKSSGLASGSTTTARQLEPAMAQRQPATVPPDDSSLEPAALTVSARAGKSTGKRAPSPRPADAENKLPDADPGTGTIDDSSLTQTIVGELTASTDGEDASSGLSPSSSGSAGGDTSSGNLHATFYQDGQRPYEAQLAAMRQSAMGRFGQDAFAPDLTWTGVHGLSADSAVRVRLSTELALAPMRHSRLAGKDSSDNQSADGDFTDGATREPPEFAPVHGVPVIWFAGKITAFAGNLTMPGVDLAPAPALFIKAGSTLLRPTWNLAPMPPSDWTVVQPGNEIEALDAIYASPTGQDGLDGNADNIYTGFSLEAAPEPSSLVPLLAGVAGGLLRRKRARRTDI